MALADTAARAKPSARGGPTAGETVIEVAGLEKTFSSGVFRRRRFQALKGATLDVRRGEVFGLLGPNGAGKTTLVKILLGITRKTGGRATILGYPAGEIAARCHVGYVPENLRIRAHHNALSAMDYYGQLSGLPMKTVRERRGPLLDLVGLSERVRDRVTQYSKGMRQRLGLAQALLHDPTLLILDEPTDGLDPVARRQIRDLIRRLQGEGKTIFLNSHILHEVEEVCDRVAILDRGEVKAFDRVENVTRLAHQGSTIRLTIDLAGPADRLDRLAGTLPGRVERPAADQLRVVAELSDQAIIDALVDRVRDAGVSLVRLDRERTSLESAFMSLLSPEPAAAPAGAIPVAGTFAAGPLPPGGHPPGSYPPGPSPSGGPAR